MLTELIATIEALRDRIRQHRSYFDMGAPELRTRVALIDPLLQALDWDVGNPSVVEIEPVVTQGRADYALLRGVGEPLLLLEAKRLSDAKAHHGQLASYIVGENMRRSIKIPYCAITNGSRWQVFDVFTQDSVLDVSVERDHPRRCALKLLALWRPALQELGIVDPVEEFGRYAVEAKHQAQKRGSSEGDTGHRATTTARQTESHSEAQIWTPLDSDTVQPSREVWPSEIRFPDGSMSKAGSWAAMLVATAKWLLDTDSLYKEEMPFTVAGTRYCVSMDGLRPDGTKFARPLFVGDTGIQIEGDFTAKQIVRFAVDLLNRYDKTPSQVALKLANR
ncbi:MAG: hypothetical protein F4Z28_15360 [Gammaproteobacteria bacterium]|nr:hypothetical protein [Gammaproteobacteria bacterium]